LDQLPLIQAPAPAVQGQMTVALSILDRFESPWVGDAARRWLRRVRRLGSEAAMADSVEAQRRRDEWGARIAAIASRGDRDAFGELFAFFAPRLKAYLQRTGEAQAEELAQETMLAVWRKAGLFDPGSASAATWIFTIARNLRIDALRRERRGGAIRVEEVEAEFAVDEEPLPDQRVLAEETDRRVRTALKKLPADQLRVIEMSFFEGRPHGEIARTLEIPLGTVKSRVRLAMARLRGQLEALR
jgi:RNA polymerase sigma-70 factor (ECF subfamily)